MSAANPTDSELVRIAKEKIDPSQRSSMPSSCSDPTDSRNLEVLVRLIVAEEFQRQLLVRSSDAPTSEGTDGDNERRRGASITAENSGGSDSDAEVMSADDVAAFLGVDRNTVYDYAGRGTIPCRRLGKRLLFHRPVLVSWLDPCKAASTRKA
jgi:excisionase family DNA binding protein